MPDLRDIIKRNETTTVRIAGQDLPARLLRDSEVAALQAQLEPNKPKPPIRVVGSEEVPQTSSPVYVKQVAQYNTVYEMVCAGISLTHEGPDGAWDKSWSLDQVMAFYEELDTFLLYDDVVAVSVALAKLRNGEDAGSMSSRVGDSETPGNSSAPREATTSTPSSGVGSGTE